MTISNGRHRAAFRLPRRVAVLALLACAAAWATVTASAGAETPPRTWRLSFEVLSARHAQPSRPATFPEKERLTRAALAQIVPHIWTALDTVASRARSRVRAGGYHTTVNPAIHSNVVTDEAEARRLAAALGYVFRQSAVLMYDLDAEPSPIRYVSVRFPRGTVTLAKTERYFARARAQLASDRLGFSVLGSRLVFVNIDTGIADDAFFAGLTRAGADMPEAGITVEPLKPVRAFLVANDWAKAQDGETYLGMIGANAEAAAELKALRERHDGRVRRWAQFLR